MQWELRGNNWPATSIWKVQDKKTRILTVMQNHGILIRASMMEPRSVRRTVGSGERRVVLSGTLGGTRGSPFSNAEVRHRRWLLFGRSDDVALIDCFSNPSRLRWQEVNCELWKQFRGTFYFLQCTKCVHFRRWSLLVTMAFQLQNFVTNSIKVQKIWNFG